MDIDRGKHQGGIGEALKRVSFCLDQLEKASAFKKGIDWQSEIATRLTVEELIGALIAAEQELVV